MRKSREVMYGDRPGRAARAARRGAAAAFGAAVVAVGSAGVSGAVGDEGLSGRTLFWAGERVDHHVPMQDPWAFRGPTNYLVSTQPSCWTYADRQDLMAEISVSAPHRYEPYPTDLDRLLFPVNETVTVDWTNVTTGARGHDVVHGGSGSALVGIPGGGGRIEMDIHLRSDQPWLHAAGSTDLPFGHSEGSVHATVDLIGKSCG